MKLRIKTSLAVCACLLVAACGGPHIHSSLLSPMPVGDDKAADAVSPGDVIEVVYYRNLARSSDAYIVGVGDVLRVDVFEHPEISRERIIVLPDGTFSLPLVSDLSAAGRGLDAVRDELTKRYAAKGILRPDVSVSVIEEDQRLRELLKSVTPIGGRSVISTRVMSSGLIDLPHALVNTTGRSLRQVREDIAERYDQEFGGRLKTTVSYADAPLRQVYVWGEVERGGLIALTLPHPFNPIKAVAAAGGFREPTAYPESVLVVRFKPDGTYDQWVFNLQGGLDDGEHDSAGFALHHGDVVYVPRSGIALANDAVLQYIRRILPFDPSAGLFFDVTD